MSNYYEYKQDNEPSVSMKARKLLDFLIDCSLVSELLYKISYSTCYKMVHSSWMM